MDEDQKPSVESTVREIRRHSRKKYSAEEKVRTPALACGASVVLEGLRGEVTIAELCRREGTHPNMYYKLSKDFLEVGKARLVAKLSLKNRILTPARAGGAREKSSLGRETKWGESDELVYLEYPLHNKPHCK